MSSSAGGRVVYELLTGPYADLKAAEAQAEVLSKVYKFNPVVTLLKTSGTEPQPEEKPAAAGDSGGENQ